MHEYVSHQLLDQDPYSVKTVRLHYDVKLWAASPSSQQAICANWCREAFGNESVDEAMCRAAPLLEEATEAFQTLIELQRKVNPQRLKDAGIYTLPEIRAFAHRIVDRVLDNPPGEITNELGGVVVAAWAAADSVKISLIECGLSELTRVLNKTQEVGIEYFHARKQKKVDAGVIL